MKTVGQVCKLDLHSLIQFMIPQIESSLFICDICGQEGTRIRYISRTYGKGDGLFVIENVLVISCPHCGESYLTAKTLHEIERIKLHRQSFAKPRPVPVAVFA